MVAAAQTWLTNYRREKCFSKTAARQKPEGCFSFLSPGCFIVATDGHTPHMMMAVSSLATTYVGKIGQKSNSNLAFSTSSSSSKIFSVKCYSHPNSVSNHIYLCIMGEMWVAVG